MKYISSEINIPQYQYSSSNQYGDHYKALISKKIISGKLRAELDNAEDLKMLILLSDLLKVPVHYEFLSPQYAFIEIISKDTLRESI